MHQVLRDLIIVFGASAFVVLIFYRLRQPPIAGYLLSGFLLSKSGLGAITDTTIINHIAEIGLVFLLFSIGIEFSIKKLLSLKRAFFLAGSMQVSLTAITIALISNHHFQSFGKALLVGVLVSLSSTAVCLKLLHSKHELNSPHGGLTMAVLLFQDLLAVPLLAIIPLLGPVEIASHSNMYYTLMLSIGYLAIIYSMTRFIVPVFLDYVVKSNIRELFLIVIAFLTFLVSWVGFEIGLSLAMGAFLAGIMVSESRYGHQILSEIAPLKDPFVAIFFVSVGLMLDGQYLFNNLGNILLTALSLFLIKLFISSLVGKVAGYEKRQSSLFGIYTSQIGEFSFVLAAAGLRAQIFNQSDFQFFLAVIVIMMLFSPSIIHMAPSLAPHLKHLDWIKMNYFPINRFNNEKQKAVDHVIIIGFGLNGMNLANNLMQSGIPYIVIENNIDTVKKGEIDGRPILFGDGSRIEVLEAAGIHGARMVVVAINDVQWVSKVVSRIRGLRPEVHLIVRCQYYRDFEELKKYQIDDVIISEELSSRAILDKVIQTFG